MPLPQLRRAAVVVGVVAVENRRRSRCCCLAAASSAIALQPPTVAGTAPREATPTAAYTPQSHQSTASAGKCRRRWALCGGGTVQRLRGGPHLRRTQKHLGPPLLLRQLTAKGARGRPAIRRRTRKSCEFRSALGFASAPPSLPLRPLPKQSARSHPRGCWGS